MNFRFRKCGDDGSHHNVTSLHPTFTVTQGNVIKKGLRLRCFFRSFTWMLESILASGLPASQRLGQTYEYPLLVSRLPSDLHLAANGIVFRPMKLSPNPVLELKYSLRK